MFFFSAPPARRPSRNRGEDKERGNCRSLPVFSLRGSQRCRKKGSRRGRVRVPGHVQPHADLRPRRLLLTHTLRPSHLIAGSSQRRPAGSRWIARREGTHVLMGRDLDAAGLRVRSARRWEGQLIFTAGGTPPSSFSAARPAPVGRRDNPCHHAAAAFRNKLPTNSSTEPYFRSPGLATAAASPAMAAAWLARRSALRFSPLTRPTGSRRPPRAVRRPQR